MQCPSIKSFLWYGTGFFPKNIHIFMHLLFKNAKKHFFNEISCKNFKYLMVLDLIHVYQYHTP
jgi:hypothetical protein